MVPTLRASAWAWVRAYGVPVRWCIPVPHVRCVSSPSTPTSSWHLSCCIAMMSLPELVSPADADGVSMHAVVQGLLIVSQCEVSYEGRGIMLEKHKQLLLISVALKQITLFEEIHTFLCERYDDEHHQLQQPCHANDGGARSAAQSRGK